MEPLEDKIECMHLEITWFSLEDYLLQRDYPFHRLERLKIETWGWDFDGDSPLIHDLAAWDLLLFPNLKVLDIRSLYLFRAFSAAAEFPVIRHLIVNCCDPGGLPDILTKCGRSLKSVDLAYDTGQSEGVNTEHKIHFPCLRCLRLVDWSNGTRHRFCFTAATPNLQAHLDDGKISTMSSVKVDTSKVKLLHVLRTPDLSQYPRLVTLCFGAKYGQAAELVRAIEWLSDNPAICPDLALIEYIRELTQEQLVKAKEALLARERLTEQKIQLVKGTVKTREERAQIFRVVEPCGDHMPCNFIDREAFDV